MSSRNRLDPIQIFNALPVMGNLEYNVAVQDVHGMLVKGKGDIIIKIIILRNCTLSVDCGYEGTLEAIQNDLPIESIKKTTAAFPYQYLPRDSVDVYKTRTRVCMHVSFAITLGVYIRTTVQCLLTY